MFTGFNRFRAVCLFLMKNISNCRSVWLKEGVPCLAVSVVGSSYEIMESLHHLTHKLDRKKGKGAEVYHICTNKIKGEIKAFMEGLAPQYQDRFPHTVHSDSVILLRLAFFRSPILQTRAPNEVDKLGRGGAPP